MLVAFENGSLFYGGGIFLVGDHLGGRFDESFPASALYFLKWRSARGHRFRSVGQDQSTVA